MNVKIKILEYHEHWWLETDNRELVSDRYGKAGHIIAITIEVQGLNIDNT